MIQPLTPSGATFTRAWIKTVPLFGEHKEAPHVDGECLASGCTSFRFSMLLCLIHNGGHVEWDGVVHLRLLQAITRCLRSI